jgi:2-dehydropantoate 2-reductase
MGSVYAGRLGAAGNDVLAVDRWQAHVDAINSKGLRLEGPWGDRSMPVRAVAVAPPEPVDLVILAVKASDVASAAAQALPLIGGDTLVLTIQNGIGSAETAAQFVGGERLAVGIASAFGASLKGPGHAHHNAMQALYFGAYGVLPFERVEALAAVWRAAGFDATAVRDIAAMQWEKLICNAAYSAPCALTGLTVGEVMDDDAMGVVSRAAASEAWAVARALGVAISVSDPVAHARAFGARVAKAKPSALQDHEAGRASEIDIINGAVVRFGTRVGVGTPVNDTLVRLVKVKERQWLQ